VDDYVVDDHVVLMLDGVGMFRRSGGSCDETWCSRIMRRRVLDVRLCAFPVRSPMFLLWWKEIGTLEERPPLNYDGTCSLSFETHRGQAIDGRIRWEKELGYERRWSRQRRR